MLVLKYLNPELEDKDFNNLAYYITNKKNNFITFNIKQKYLIDMEKGRIVPTGTVEKLITVW